MRFISTGNSTIHLTAANKERHPISQNIPEQDDRLNLLWWKTGPRARLMVAEDTICRSATSQLKILRWEEVMWVSGMFMDSKRRAIPVKEANKGKWVRGMCLVAEGL
ncbi:hypothetical protein JTE90_006242 [Oedothorax gibbosus]|uniref:Uncharacterized protein n=1 Tax=Oedothorax gibbosus TaxID=931172 RepID=A0AAV6VTZ5_9ARAC|nr:hypothetical protein JTE90_006242 [Oedothorax gibbosus]